jgi:DNA-binding NarL/FixJ family response regulator
MTSRRPSTQDTAARPPRTSLSRRDVDLLRLLAEGRSTGYIAASLSVTGNTVRTRIHRVERKLGVTGRAAAVRAARDVGGLVGIPRPRSAPGASTPALDRSH